MLVDCSVDSYCLRIAVAVPSSAGVTIVKTVTSILPLLCCCSCHANASLSLHHLTHRHHHTIAVAAPLQSPLLHRNCRTAAVTLPLHHQCIPTVIVLHHCSACLTIDLLQHHHDVIVLHHCRFLCHLGNRHGQGASPKTTAATPALHQLSCCQVVAEQCPSPISAAAAPG